MRKLCEEKILTRWHSVFTEQSTDIQLLKIFSKEITKLSSKINKAKESKQTLQPNH
jgi:hypothetical protein